MILPYYRQRKKNSCSHSQKNSHATQNKHTNGTSQMNSTERCLARCRFRAAVARSKHSLLSHARSLSSVSGEEEMCWFVCRLTRLSVLMNMTMA